MPFPIICFLLYLPVGWLSTYKFIDQQLTMLLVRSGRLAIGGGGASSSNSELVAWAGLWQDWTSASVGVVLLGLELETLLSDEPKTKYINKSLMLDRPHFNFLIKFTKMLRHFFINRKQCKHISRTYQQEEYLSKQFVVIQDIEMLVHRFFEMHNHK